MKNYKFTLFGAFLAVVYYVLNHGLDLDLFERLVSFLDNVEHLEIDEIIIGGFIILIFFHADLAVKRHRAVVEEEKSKIYRAMLFGVHHILNNFLHQLQYFRIKADATTGFDKNVLQLYDRMIDDTMRQVAAMGEVTELDEDSIRKSVMPR